MMPLRALPFSEDTSSLVGEFHCGDEAWCHELNDWLANDALSSIHKRGTSVWLYVRDEDNAVIGYGSLGPTKWRFPDPTDPRQNVTIIPALAIASEYQGASGNGVRHSDAIMGDLIARAREMAPDVLVLYVHEDNGRAIHFYERIGFKMLAGANGEYRRMFIDVSS